MSNETQKDLESIGEAARRLLAEMEERLGRPSGEKPERIKGGGSAQAAKNALELLPPVAPVRLGGAGLGCRGFYGETLRINSAANDDDVPWW